MEWQNAQNVEKKLKTRKKHGKWLANPIKKENEHNSQSVSTSAAEKPSDKFSTKRKSKLLLLNLFLFPTLRRVSSETSHFIPTACAKTKIALRKARKLKEYESQFIKQICNSR